jgi:hypothetical protein
MTKSVKRKRTAPRRARVGPENAEYDGDGRILAAPIPAEMLEDLRTAQAQRAKFLAALEKVDRDRTQALARAIARELPPPATKPKNGADWQVRRVMPIIAEIWGRRPPDIIGKVAVAKVNDAFGRCYPGRTVSRSTITRAVKRLARAPR